jgi:hypothetical protein
MSIDFSEIDLSSVVDEMDTMMEEAQQTYKPERIDTRWINSDNTRNVDQSRVTASGFTDSDSETVSALPTRLTSKELKDRLKIARDISGMLRHLRLTDDQTLYCNDMISRFSNKNADQDPKHIQVQDLKMISTISALSNLKMKEISDEVLSDVTEMKDSLKSMLGFNRRRRADSVVSESTIAPQARTIIADDSASMVTRPLKLNRSMQSSRISQQPQQVYSDVSASVIGGYQPVLSAVDEDDGVDISPIYGLPVIFTNDRLNFLCHLHRPLKDLLTEGGKYPGSDILGKLDRFVRRHKGRERDPASNLLYLVIRKTISMEKLQVKNNDSFRLPLLKRGMFLTEKLIYMSIDQLHNEFCAEWFSTMEDIEVPDFHSKYSQSFQSSPVRRTTTTSKKSSRSVLNF